MTAVGPNSTKCVSAVAAGRIRRRWNCLQNGKPNSPEGCDKAESRIYAETFHKLHSVECQDSSLNNTKNRHKSVTAYTVLG